MIQVEFYPNDLKLSIKGHAGHAEPGKDIVCAAASILYYTLCQSLTDSEDLLKKAGLIISMNEEESSVQAKPKKGSEATIQHIFWVVLEGIQLLADDYPKNVTLDIA